MTFAELELDADLVDALASHGITEPFPIQQEAIPLALAGNDLIGQAKTGTGKTMGFGLPLLQHLGANPEPGVKALVVAPTRELATQIAEDLESVTGGRATKIAAIYGGKSYDGQIAALHDGAEVVVGTPGRLLDLQRQHILQLGNVRTVVLDEADKMLDLGFLPDVEALFDKLPDVHQTMLFSATMPGAVLALARRFLTHPIHIRISDPDEGQTQANIKQFIYRAHHLDKDEVISRILQAEGRGKTIIFTRTKRQAAKLADELADRGFKSIAVHGDLNQAARERNLNRFRNENVDVLVATDVAARGIDVDDVTHVINYTIPDDEQDYLHRIGRTGRAGKLGTAITFVDWEDSPRWSLIDKALEFGQPEPKETYSTSPHLYTDLNIPADAKGRLVPARPKARHDGNGRSGNGHSGTGRNGDRRNGHRRNNSHNNEHRGEQQSEHSNAETESHQAEAHQQESPKAAAEGAAPRRRRRRHRRSQASAGEQTSGVATSASPAE